MKILCGLPNMGEIPTKTCISLIKLKLAFPDVIEFMFVQNSLVYVAREAIINRALEEKFDSVLFVDSDMVFEPDDFEKLVEVSFGIVSGLYYTRIEPARPVAYKDVQIKTVDKEPSVTEIIVDTKKTLQSAEAIGFGFVLIKRAALLVMKDRYSELFTPKWGCGEDIAFCIRAKKCGLGIFVRTDTQLGHVGEKVYRG